MKILSETTIDTASTVGGHPFRQNVAGSVRYQLDTSGRMDPKVLVHVRDEFLGFNTSSGSIGQLGWSAASSGTVTAAVEAATANHVGVVSITTGAAVATTGLNLCSTASRVLNPADNFDLIFIAKVTDNTLFTYSFGLYDGTNGSTAPSNGIYIVRSGSNYLGTCRSGGSQTQTASLGVTVDTGWHSFRMRRVNASTIGFSVDDGTEATVTTNVPTAILNPYIGMFVNEAVAKAVHLDYFDLTVGVTR